MKRRKILAALVAFGMLFAPTNKLIGTSAEDAIIAAKKGTNWTFSRTNFETTADGLKFSQTEMGTPDSHAISILEVPFTDTNEFEITFKITMDEYVATGRNANDVWAGIGIMGQPVFINWRNNAEDEPSPLTGHGRAKDSPGLFTRFFNYSGDLRYEGSVYHENYHTLGEESGPADIVDTWRLYEGNAGASIQSEITLKLVYETSDDSGQFYNVYINGTNITENGEAAFIEKDVIFADGKIYLLLVMNTQESAFNELSTMTVKNINGYSYLNSHLPDTSEGSEVPPTSDTPPSEGTSTGGTSSPSSTPTDETPRTGCFSTNIVSSLSLTIALGAFGLFLYFRRRHLLRNGS